jgi:hypothetical protein
VSPSVSPSVPVADYTRGEYAALPAGITDLTTGYSAQDYTDVGSSNDVRVGQGSTLQYAIHQFKDYVALNSCRLNWEGQTNTNPVNSPVVLQIYNRTSGLWETKASNAVAAINTDFVLQADMADLTNYKDINDVIVCRVYQLAV